jgi:hypothetical protein
MSIPIQPKFGIFSKNHREGCRGYTLPSDANSNLNEVYYLSGLHQQSCLQISEMGQTIGSFPMSYEKPVQRLDQTSLLGKLQALGANDTEIVSVNRAFGQFVAAVTKVFRDNPHDP